MFEYNVCTEPDEALFLKQCAALEKNIPNLQKGICLEDVDGSQTQLYRLNDSKIAVHNSFYVGALYVESDIDLLQFFNNNA